MPKHYFAFPFFFKYSPCFCVPYALFFCITDFIWLVQYFYNLCSYFSFLINTYWIHSWLLTVFTNLPFLHCVFRCSDLLLISAVYVASICNKHVGDYCIIKLHSYIEVHLLVFFKRCIYISLTRAYLYQLLVNAFYTLLVSF